MQMQLVALTVFFTKQIRSLERNCAISQLLSVAAPLTSYFLNSPTDASSAHHAAPLATV